MPLDPHIAVLLRALTDPEAPESPKTEEQEAAQAVTPGLCATTSTPV